MARRQTNYKINKFNRIKSEYATGHGDTLYIGFNCLNPNCKNIIFQEKNKIYNDNTIKETWKITCDECGFEHTSDGKTKLFDYSLDRLLGNNNLDNLSQDVDIWESLETGTFTINHQTYIESSIDFKYCVLCCSLQPVTNFGKHASRKTKRQGECIICKNTYNSFKNRTRTSDQMNESSQKRRLFGILSQDTKIDHNRLIEKFNNQCFNCKDSFSKSKKPNIDHTLPAKYLWSLSTENATLLCSECNGNKSDKWPNEFYSTQQLKELSILTGFSVKELTSSPHFSPSALELFSQENFVDDILINYAKYIDDIIRLRNRILALENIDIFSYSTNISKEWIDKANSSI